MCHTLCDNGSQVNTNLGLFMSKENKDYIVKGRVDQAQYNKLEKHCESVNMSMSEWIRDKIAKIRIKS